MRRGDICWYRFAPPDKRRPVLILTRSSIIPILGEVTVAPLTTRIRNIPSEVRLDRADGMHQACAANFDHLQTISKNKIGRLITRLGADRMAEAKRSLLFALGFDD
jgi:mRNA interferase MazF